MGRKQIIRNYRLMLLKYRQKKLINTDFTILSNDCIGGVISSDLGLPFRSPTINLYFANALDYIKFLSNLNHYLAIDLIFTKIYGEKFNYPVGMLDDIEIHFMHYDTAEEAQKKWDERKKRININNLFVIASFLTCSQDIVEAFDKLPYENKLFFSSQNYPDLKSVVWFKEHQNKANMPNIIPRREWLKHIDLIKWLNKKAN